MREKRRRKVYVERKKKGKRQRKEREKKREREGGMKTGGNKPPQMNYSYSPSIRFILHVPFLFRQPQAVKAEGWNLMK